MEHYLDYLLRFVTELRNTNSRILKEEILAKRLNRDSLFM